MCGGYHAKFQDSRTKNKKSPRPFHSIWRIRENYSVCIIKMKTNYNLIARLIAAVQPWPAGCWLHLQLLLYSPCLLSSMVSTASLLPLFSFCKVLQGFCEVQLSGVKWRYWESGWQCLPSHIPPSLPPCRHQGRHQPLGASGGSRWHGHHQLSGPDSTSLI